MNYQTVLILISAVVLVECSEGYRSYGNNNRIEPCQHRTDFADCVREYFHDHGSCDVVRHPPRGPMTFFPTSIIYSPWINMTYKIDRMHLVNLDNTEIQTFYLNRDTGNLVMTLNIKDLQLSSDSTNYFINRYAKEPLRIKGSMNGRFDAILTAIIPTRARQYPNDFVRINGNDILRTTVTAYVPNDRSYVKFGPQLTESHDPEVLAVVHKLRRYMSTVVKELWMTGALNIFARYIQTYFCNFHVELSDRGL